MYPFIQLILSDYLVNTNAQIEPVQNFQSLALEKENQMMHDFVVTFLDLLSK